LPVSMRQQRDSATASKLFFLVAIDEEGWSHYAHGWVALQEIHSIETGFMSRPLGPVEAPV